MSSDGTKLAAVEYGGGIWNSTDSGVTWIRNTSFSQTPQWRAITSSDDFTKLAACGTDNYIWTSNDSGATWVQNNSSNIVSPKNWMNIVSSSDGTKLVALIAGSDTIWTF